MKNPFLLIAGYYDDPSSGTDNWIECFQTREFAQTMLVSEDRGKWRYIISGIEYDWYEIVDLREWTEND
jgi:hypothetical protein